MGRLAYLLVYYLTQFGRMDIVELATYAQKGWYFILICFFLGFMARAIYNVIDPLLSSNNLHRTVGETVPTLYPRKFVSLGSL